MFADFFSRFNDNKHIYIYIYIYISVCKQFLGCKGWGVPVTNLDQLAER